MPIHRIFIIEINFFNAFFDLEFKYEVVFIISLIDIAVNPDKYLYSINKEFNYK
jgi:hypothetical protein